MTAVDESTAVDTLTLEPPEVAEAAATTGEAARPTRPGSLPYNPALDGIRGIAVAAVLLFHGEFSWARGGYLGVSTFFTLSGFLITSLLLVEFADRGRISLTAFWARRLRRLLPAAAVTLGAIALSSFLLSEAWERSLRGDIQAAVLNVANWRFLFDERPYGELFDSPSPVLHFWSLAIEEQFYWVFPLFAAGLLWLVRGRLWVFGTVLAAIVGTIAVISRWPEAVGLDRLADDTIYYSTPIRMAEILMGSLLAVVVSRGAIVGSRRLASLAAMLGVAALAMSAWAWWNVEDETPLLYRGGLVAYAGVSALLVLGACVPGPVRSALSLEPLRSLGVISYGVYLIHWPVFLVLDEERVDRLLPFGLQPRGVMLFLIKLVPTLLLAVLSYRLLERPIRRGERPRIVNAPLLAVGSVAAVLVVGVVVPKLSPPPEDQFDAFAEAQAEIDARIDAAPASVPRVLFFGDSSALTISAGVGTWGLDTQRLVSPGEVTELGCSVARGGERRQNGDVTEVPADKCNWEQRWAEEADANPEARTAVILTGAWDVVDRRLPGDDTWRAPGDPVYDDFLRDELGAATDLLLSKGLNVVWLTTPELEFGRDGKAPPGPPDTQARVDRLNALIREVAAGRDDVEVVDLAAWFASLPPGEDERLRPDGIHVTLATSMEAAEWLGPQILRAAGLE